MIIIGIGYSASIPEQRAVYDALAAKFESPQMLAVSLDDACSGRAIREDLLPTEPFVVLISTKDLDTLSPTAHLLRTAGEYSPVPNADSVNNLLDYLEALAKTAERYHRLDVADIYVVNRSGWTSVRPIGRTYHEIRQGHIDEIC